MIIHYSNYKITIVIRSNKIPIISLWFKGSLKYNQLIRIRDIKLKRTKIREATAIFLYLKLKAKRDNQNI